MTDEKKIEFDVAFSFTQKDEELASQIKDLIQDRFKTFLYSEQQKKLAGADGEKVFNEVFIEKSRLVVILYRKEWGETSWTRIEENAIRSRAHDEGYDFTTFVQLDKDAQMPKWLPKNRIYFNFDRWGIKGLASVIEARVEELGGQCRPESVTDRAERLKRERLAEQLRETFLNSHELRGIANFEMIAIIDKLKKYKTQIEDPSTKLHLATSEKPNEEYEFSTKGFTLSFKWSGLYTQDIRNAYLKVNIHVKSGDIGFNYKETIIKVKEYKIDRDLIGNIGWCDYHTGKNFILTNELIDNWVKKFMEDLSKYKPKY
jgi:hypothetical protein